MAEEEKIASLLIDGSQAKAELDKLQAEFIKTGAAAEKTGASFEKTSKRLAETDAATRRLLTSIPGTTAALGEMGRRTAALDRELASGRITADDHAKAIERLQARYTGASAAASKMEQETARLSAEMNKLNSTFAKFHRGDIIQAQSGLINFTQQVTATGNATQALAVQLPELIPLFGKLPGTVQAASIGFIAFSAAAGAVAARIADIESEARRTEAVIGRLNASMRGFDSRGAAFDIANAVGVSRGDASAAVDQIIRNRKIQDQALVRALAQSAVEVSRVVGEDVGKVSQEISEAFGKGAAGVLELDKSLNFLSPSMAKYIRDLDEAGRRSEAMGKAAEALGDKFNGAAKEMASSWGEAFREIGNGLDALIEKAAKSDLSKHLARGFGNMGRGLADLVTPDDPSVEIVRKQRDLRQARDVLESLVGERMAGVPLAAGAEEIAARRVHELTAEVESLIEAQRRLARQSEENAKIGGGLVGVSDSERKALDTMTDAFNRESEAMKGNAADRSIRLAGLAAEREALEQGRSAAAATEARLLSEAKARRDLSISIEDQLRSQREELALSQALAAAGGDRRQETMALADAERRRVRAQGGTMAQANEAADIALKLDAAQRQQSLSTMALGQRQQFELLERERALVGATGIERAKITAELQTQNRLLGAGVDLGDAGAKAMVENAKAMAEYQTRLAESQEMARSVSGILSGGAEDLFLGLNKSKDILGEMGERFNRLFVRKAVTEPLDRMLTGALGSLLAPDMPGMDRNNTPTAKAVDLRGQTEATPLYVQVVGAGGAVGRDPVAEIVSRSVGNAAANNGDIRAMVAAEAARQGVPVNLALGVAQQESGFRQNVVGAGGAVGRDPVAEIVSRSAGNAAANNGDIRAMVAAEAARQGVPVNLALGVAQQESGFRQNLTSKAGAHGVMQLMPGTARGLGVDPNDVGQNVVGGVAYLAQRLTQRNGDERLALMDYNWGPGNVDAWLKTGVGVKGQPMPAETQAYVPAVMAHAQRFANDNSIMVGPPHRAVPLQNEGVVPGMVYAPAAKQGNWLESLLGSQYRQLSGGAANALGAYLNQPGISLGGSLAAAGGWPGVGDSLMSLAQLTGVDKALGFDGLGGIGGLLDKPLYGGTPISLVGDLGLADGASGLTGVADKLGGGLTGGMTGGITVGNALGGAMSAFSAFQSFKAGNVPAGIGKAKPVIIKIKERKAA